MAKRRGAQFWRRHVEAWERSDLTQAAYCAAHGLSSKSFYRWRHRQVAVRSSSSSAPLTLVPVTVGGAARTDEVVRVRSPGGWSIELGGGDVAWLAELLRRLP